GLDRNPRQLLARGVDIRAGAKRQRDRGDRAVLTNVVGSEERHHLREVICGQGRHLVVRRHSDHDFHYLLNFAGCVRNARLSGLSSHRFRAAGSPAMPLRISSSYTTSGMRATWCMSPFRLPAWLKSALFASMMSVTSCFVSMTALPSVSACHSSTFFVTGSLDRSLIRLFVVGSAKNARPVVRELLLRNQRWPPIVTLARHSSAPYTRSGPRPRSMRRTRRRPLLPFHATAGWRRRHRSVQRAPTRAPSSPTC